METAVICRHCQVPHINFKCACTHEHTNHTYGGGCQIKGCLCDRYDPSKSGPAKVVTKEKKAKAVVITESEEDSEYMLRNIQVAAELVAAQERVAKLRKSKEDIQEKV